MNTPELYTDGKSLLFCARRKTDPLRTLGPRQLQYLRDKGWIDRRRVVRLDAARSETV